MNKVSYQLIGVISHAVGRLKAKAPQDILKLLPDNCPDVQKKSGYLDWDLFADWIEQLNSIYGPIDWRQVGVLAVQRKTNPLLIHLSRLTLSVRSTYWLAAKWFGPSQVPSIRCQFEDLGPNKIRETLTLAEGAKPCPSLFEMFAGSQAAAPSVAFGLPFSDVKATTSGRQGIYDITFPVQYGLWTKIKILVSGLFQLRNLLQELANQQGALQEQAQTLQTERVEFKNLIEQFPDGILIHKDGTVRYINAKLASYLPELERQSAVGKSVFEFIDTSDLEIVKQKMAAGPDRYYKLHEISLKTVHHSKPVPCSYTAIPISFEGEPATAIVIRDLTEQKKMQAQLMLNDRMRSLGQLAAGIGHEINNPIYYVMMKADELSRYLLRIGDSSGIQTVTEIQEGLSRISEIVRQLKSFSRSQDEAPIPVDAVHVMNSAIQMARNTIALRAQLEVHTEPTKPILANEASLGQVFLNLLLNAAQSMEEGNAAENKIKVEIRPQRPGWVSIAIQDTGAGIPEAIRKNLFQPFYTTKAVGEGTGLGLSICHSIVSRYKGTIDFKSEIGQGTTFQVLLPTAPQMESSDSPSEPLGFIQKTNGRVLLVDDDQALLETLENVIAFHFKTSACSDPRVALEKIRAGESFDCIVCDLMMPHLDGQQFYNQLRTVRPDLCAKTLFLTGGSYSQKHDAFLSQAGIQYLEKPIQMPTLLNRIQDVILTNTELRHPSPSSP